MKKIDVAFISVPRMGVSFPPPALAILKSCAQDAGFVAKAYDLNVDLWHEVRNLPNDPWVPNWGVFESKQDEFDAWWNTFANDFTTNYLKKILESNPGFIGISIMGGSNHLAAKKICKLIKVLQPQVKIVVGGSGISKKAYILDSVTDYLNKGLADYAIVGEGELAIVSLLRGNLRFPGIYEKASFENAIEPQTINDLSQFSFPDYSDFDFSKYIGNKELTFYPSRNDQFGLKILPITGSRGCVKNCTFCNVKAYWPKFRIKSPEYLAEEMIHQYFATGVREFFFTDSIINASVPVLEKFCRYLINFQKLNNVRFEWHASGICQSQVRQPEYIFQLMSEAGCRLIYIGIESASESVRLHMGKSYTDTDLWFTLEQYKKYNISFWALMVVGYPTELVSDFEKNLVLADELKQRGFLEKNIFGLRHCTGINCFEGTAVFGGTPLEKMLFGDKGLPSPSASLSWTYETSEGLNDFSLRANRVYRLYKHCEKIDFPIGPLDINRLSYSISDIIGRSGAD